MLQKSIKKLDFFGIDVKWNYGGANKHKTIVGFIISIVFFGMGFYTAYQIGVALFSYSSPEVTKSTFFDSDPNPIDVSGKTIGFAVGIQDPLLWYSFIDKTIWDLEVIHTEARRQIDPNTKKLIVNTTQSSLALASCADVPESHVSKLEGIAPENETCFANPNQDIQLQGVWESPIYQTIDFRFRSCINTTANGNHCKSPEEIKKKLRGSWLSVTFADQQIDVENVEEPGQFFRAAYFALLDPATPKFMQMLLKNIEIETDTGILMENQRIQKYAQFQSAHETFSSLPMSEGEFLWIRVKVSNYRDFYKRRYDKLFSVLPKLFSLLKGYLIILIFVINPLQRFQFHRKFIRECCAIDAQSFQFALQCGKDKKNIKQKGGKDGGGDSSLHQNSNILDNYQGKGQPNQLELQPRSSINGQNIQTQSTQAIGGIGNPSQRHSQCSEAVYTENDSMMGFRNSNHPPNNDTFNQHKQEVIAFSEPTTPKDDQIQASDQESQQRNDSSIHPKRLSENRKSSFAKIQSSDQQKIEDPVNEKNSEDGNAKVNEGDTNNESAQNSKEQDAKSNERKELEKEDQKLSSYDIPIKSEDIRIDTSQLSIQNPNDSSETSQDFGQEQKTGINPNKSKKKAFKSNQRQKSHIIDKSARKSKFSVGFSGIREEKISNPRNQGSQKSIYTQTLERIRKQYFPEDMRSCEISISEFIYSQFGSKIAKDSSKKRMLFDAGQACIEETLDVKKFFLLKNEVELFKVLLLSPEELELFESISNEKINVANHLKIQQ